MASYEYKIIGIKCNGVDNDTVIRFMECFGLKNEDIIGGVVENLAFDCSIMHYIWFNCVGSDLNIYGNPDIEDDLYGCDDAARLFEFANAYLGRTDLYFKAEEGQTASDTYMGVDELYSISDDGTALLKTEVHSYSNGYPYDFGDNGYFSFERAFYFGNDISTLLKLGRKKAKAIQYSDILKLLKKPEYYENMKMDTDVIYSDDGKTLIHVPVLAEERFTVKEGVQTIGKMAFFGCKKLKRIDLPNSIKMIDKYAFSGCSELLLLFIPDSVTIIRSRAFAGCEKLRSLKVPDCIEELANNAFTDLSYLSLPKQYYVNYKDDLIKPIIEKSPKLSYLKINTSQMYFRNPKPDQFIIFNGEITGFISAYDIKDMHLSVKKRIKNNPLIIPYGVITLTQNALAYCRVQSKRLSEVVISVELPETMEELGEYVFMDWTSLKRISIPDSITKIAPNAFDGCSSLSEIILGKNSHFIISDGALWTKDMQTKIVELAK